MLEELTLFPQAVHLQLQVGHVDQEQMRLGSWAGRFLGKGMHTYRPFLVGILGQVTEEKKRRGGTPFGIRPRRLTRQQASRWGRVAL